jgi:hypothetical protein
MNARGLGGVRFLWEKATTQDDRSSNGVPHSWWDRYTAPVVLSYGRFDLSFSAYGILMMADQTPAWREVYPRIIDEFAKRYPTYWGAVDWLTQIGDDPKRARYPQSVMATLPQEEIRWAQDHELPLEPTGCPAVPARPIARTCMSSTRQSR